MPEPIGGAHRDPEAAIESAGTAIQSALDALAGMSRDQLRAARADKFLAMGRKL